MHLFLSSVGRLRLIGFLEGTSLLLLVLVAVPMKYFYNSSSLVQITGPIHGSLFLLYCINTVSVSITYHWKFKEVTWKVLIACLIPFGTYYVDRKILSKL